MTNNDIMRRIRYTFDFNDAKMIAIFDSVGQKVTRELISNWLKKDDDDEDIIDYVWESNTGIKKQDDEEMN